MRNMIGSFVHKLFSDQRGQVLPWVAAGLVALLGLGGLSVDLGNAYVARADLQNYANAAALAAAGNVYNTSSTSGATTYANDYSGSGTNENANPGLSGVTTSITTMCLNMLMPGGASCTSTSPANAVKVTESISVPTYFMRLFGKTSISLSAVSMASMQGMAQPWNVAIIVDATSSMGDAPPSGSCSGYSTEFACALAGIETLLQNVNPCGGVSSCTTATAKFRVALFSFPNVYTGTASSGKNPVSYDWTCAGTPTHELYTFPDATLKTTSPEVYKTALTSYTPLTYSSVDSTYEVTPTSGSYPSEDGDANGFVSDYWSGSSSNYLNSSSSIVEETAGGCMKNPGGESTYYGGVIYAAQAALAAEQNTYSGSKNAIIILSDGQANADSSKFASGSPSPSADGLSYISSPTTTTGYYPSSVNECQQAIMAAQAAQAAGTTVYSVAFDSESDGCAVSGSGVTVTDTSLVAAATSGNTALSLSTLTPCIVMKNMASPASGNNSYFYADTSSSSSGCTDTAHTVSTIGEIFDAISASFTTPRLLPASASGLAVTTTN